MYTQKYDNQGYWLAPFDGKNLALPLHSIDGETYNMHLLPDENPERMNFIPKDREYEKCAGFEERPY